MRNSGRLARAALGGAAPAIALAILATMGAAAQAQTAAAPGGPGPARTEAASTGIPAGAVDLTDAMLAANAALPRPAPIPTATFAAQPDFREPRLSPQGKRFAARQFAGGKEFICVYTMDSSEKVRSFAVPEGMSVIRYFWAGNDRILVDVGQTVPWFDDEAVQTRLILIDLAANKVQLVGRPKDMALKGDDVLWVDPEGKSLLLAYQADIYQYPGVYSIDLETNKTSRVVAPFGDIWDWYADNSGVVRYGYGWPSEHRWHMVYRKTAADRFTEVARGTDKDDDQSGSARDKAFTMAAGTDEGYSFSVNEATGLNGVYRYNFATHTLGERVFEAPGVDIDSATATENGTAMFSAYYTDKRDRVKWFDPTLAALQDNFDKAVNGALGEREVWIASRSRDNSVLIVQVLGSDDPGRFYIYQEATGRLSVLTKPNPALSPAVLTRTQYVHYTARDGTVLPAYLTLPKGRAAKGLPLIVMPHGGPYGVRDHGDYDADVQFLANRGYAVLQPQYRGSGSLGKKFDEKGAGQWGRAMQDDLDDGMDWLVKRGIADPKRACIVGASYGGYAAIWGATRNPERWRCSVSFAGIADVGRQLKYQMNSDSNKQSRERWRQKVQGDAAFDLRTVSGLYNIDRLTVPIMLVHGDRDQTVPVKQSRSYAEALKAAGKTYEYHELAGEGHGFSTAANAQTWYDRLDAFLKQHNPAD